VSHVGTKPTYLVGGQRRFERRESQWCAWPMTHGRSVTGSIGQWRWWSVECRPCLQTEVNGMLVIRVVNVLNFRTIFLCRFFLNTMLW